MSLNPERLQTIDRFLKSQYIDEGRIPGALFRVMHKGQTVHQSIQGYADVAAQRALQDDSLFRIYSMTKPITSVATMMLVEEARIMLDDPVTRYLPELEKLRVYQSGTLETGFQTTALTRPMRIVDLLAHTAGFTYGFQRQSPVDAAYRAMGVGTLQETPFDLSEMVRRLAEIPLEFSPGEAWCYSVATDVLGLLIERVSGQSLDAFFKERIFEPLGMDDTDFYVPAHKASRFVQCYQPSISTSSPKMGMVLQDDVATSLFLKPPVFLSGGGGLVSTADDFSRFTNALQGYGPRLLGRKTIEQMRANHLPDGRYLPEVSRSAFSEAQYNGVWFGLGFGSTGAIERTLIAGNNGDYFWGGVASTFFWIDPVAELCVQFYTQLMPSSTWPIRRQLRAMVYAALD